MAETSSRENGLMNLVLRHWVLLIVLPAVLGGLAVASTFLWKKSSYRSSRVVTALKMTGAEKSVSLPFDRPELYVRFFRNDEIVKALSERYGFSREGILTRTLSVEEYSGQTFQGGSGIEVRVEADSSELASSVLDYVVETGIQSFNRAMQQHIEPIRKELEEKSDKAENDLEKARGSLKEFLSAANLAELERRVKDRLELCSWRESSRDKLEVDLKALKGKQAELEKVLKQEPKTVELQKVLSEDPLLERSLNRGGTTRPSEPPVLVLRQTEQNPAYVEARSLMIRSLDRRSQIEGQLDAISEQTPEADQKLKELSKELVSKQAEIKVLDEKCEQALAGARTAREQLLAVAQMPWPPQRLAPLPALVKRQSAARWRLTIGFAVFVLSFIIVASALARKDSSIRAK